MPRATVAVVDLNALRFNFRRAAALASPAESMAVVKADGYGHGLEAVAGALADLTSRYAVACLEEAERLRKTGLMHPVVLLQGVHDKADWPRCAEAGFEVVVHESGQLEDLFASASGSQVLWIKVNTGMNRLGFMPDDIAGIIERVRRRPNIRLRGLVTHLACADDPGHPMNAHQIGLMAALQNAFPGLEISVANSAAHYRDGDAAFHWTRPGIMLYGGTPLLGKTGQDLGLQPVMTLQSQLIAVRELDKGDKVGYGAAWQASEPCRMGIVAIGYGDGYPRHAPAGTPVWVRGRRVPLIGRVSMDMIAVELTDVPSAQPGDMVELWGGHVSVDEVARLAGTISYELLAGLTPRVPRRYLAAAS